MLRDLCVGCNNCHKQKTVLTIGTDNCQIVFFARHTLIVSLRSYLLQGSKTAVRAMYVRHRPGGKFGKFESTRTLESLVARLEKYVTSIMMD